MGGCCSSPVTDHDQRAERSAFPAPPPAALLNRQEGTISRRAHLWPRLFAPGRCPRTSCTFGGLNPLQLATPKSSIARLHHRTLQSTSLPNGICCVPAASSERTRTAMSCTSSRRPSAWEVRPSSSVSCSACNMQRRTLICSQVQTDLHPLVRLPITCVRPLRAPFRTCTSDATQGSPWSSWRQRRRQAANMHAKSWRCRPSAPAPATTTAPGDPKSLVPTFYLRCDLNPELELAVTTICPMLQMPEQYQAQ